MSKIYYLRYLNDTLGSIEYPSCRFTKNPKYTKPMPITFLGGTSNPNPSEVEDFLKGLVIQEDNDGIDLVMKNLGYPMYDLEVLLDETCGMQPDSGYWVVTEDKLDWKYETHHVQTNPSLWMDTLDGDL